MFKVMLTAGLALASWGADLPDPKLTPGATLDVPLSKLCEKGYASSVRNVPASIKRRVYTAYDIKSPKPGNFEVDHLVSLELAGSNDIANLWPQSYLTKPWNAHVKDALEDRLHSLVCASDPTITLNQAQEAIRTDWIAEYKKIFKTEKPLRE